MIHQRIITLVKILINDLKILLALLCVFSAEFVTVLSSLVEKKKKVKSACTQLLKSRI